ncbi:MAG: response regulator transcription factor [Bacteroidetes bacterium]|nr:response regulator transcription factor [Bacteroidota bacterium]
MSDDPITVLVADDHTIVRRGLVSLLSIGDSFNVVGEAADGRVAVDLALELEPDVVLMDVSMPVLNGLEATSRIKKKAPHIKVLILSAYDKEEYVLQVIRSGASGYLLKNSPSEDLYAAVRSVCSGHAFFSPSVSKILADGYLKKVGSTSGQDNADVSPGGRLTSREREVLQLVAEGRTHQEVADMLHISSRTVDTHCNNIMKKLDIHDSAGLVTYAIQNGIVILPR